MFNLDASLRRLREEAGWSTKKEAHFVIWLESHGYIEDSPRPGHRMVSKLSDRIQEFESEAAPYGDEPNGTV